MKNFDDLNDPRSTDFRAVRALLGDRGWYPEDEVREILRVDGGRVRLLVTASHYVIECGDPFIGGVAEVMLPRGASYGMVRVMAEQVRMVADLAGKRGE